MSSLAWCMTHKFSFAKESALKNEKCPFFIFNYMAPTQWFMHFIERVRALSCYALCFTLQMKVARPYGMRNHIGYKAAKHLRYFRWRQPQSAFIKTRTPKSNDDIVMQSHWAIYCLWTRRTKHCVSNCLRGFLDTIMIHLSPSKSHIDWLTECIKHLDHIETSFRSQRSEVIAKQTHVAHRLVSIFPWLCSAAC